MARRAQLTDLHEPQDYESGNEKYPNENFKVMLRRISQIPNPNILASCSGPFEPDTTQSKPSSEASKIAIAHGRPSHNHHTV